MGLAVVTGGSSGLGKCIVEELDSIGYNVFNWDLSTGVDVGNMASVRKSVGQLEGMRVDILINCAGINKLDFLPDISTDDMDTIFGVNTFGIFNTVQALLPNMRGDNVHLAGTVINIVSDAARRPMTTSLCYNASKAAALAMTMQMHRELIVTHCISVMSVSPAKLTGTAMSKYIDERVPMLRGWTQEETDAKQNSVLNSGKEVNPLHVAEFIAWIAASKQRQINFGGCDIPFGGA